MTPTPGLKSFHSFPLPPRSSSNSSRCPTKPSLKLDPSPRHLCSSSLSKDALLINSMKRFGFSQTFHTFPRAYAPGFLVWFRILLLLHWGNSFTSFGGSDINLPQQALFDIFRLRSPCLMWAFCMIHTILSRLLGADLFTYLSSPLDSQLLEVKDHVLIIIISSDVCYV